MTREKTPDAQRPPVRDEPGRAVPGEPPLRPHAGATQAQVGGDAGSGERGRGAQADRQTPREGYMGGFDSEFLFLD